MQSVLDQMIDGTDEAVQPKGQFGIMLVVAGLVLNGLWILLLVGALLEMIAWITS